MTHRLSLFSQRQKPIVNSFMSLSLVTALLCGWLVCPAEAAEWSGRGEFGLVVARGNTESETGNLSFEILRETAKWRNELTASALRSRDRGTETASRYTAGYKSDYKFDETSYLFGASRYERDRFSNYTYQATLSLGYGHQLLETERQRLRIEGGPGVRRTEERDTGDVDTDAIARLSANYRFDMTDTSRLTNRTLVESGSSNTFLENVSALEVAINSRLALKLSLAVRHNTDVEPERKKTDTLTTANIVYNFL